MSALKAEREAASRHLAAPVYRYEGDRNELIKAVHDALYCSKICAYAQGFQLMRAAKPNMDGNWISPRSRVSGAAVASFGRASYKKLPMPMGAIPGWLICYWIRTSKNKFKRIRRAGAQSWHSRLRRGLLLPPSCRPWRIMTAIDPRSFRQISYKLSGIISAPTPTNVSINRPVYRSTSIGPKRTVHRSRFRMHIKE